MIYVHPTYTSTPHTHQHTRTHSPPTPAAHITLQPAVSGSVR